MANFIERAFDNVKQFANNYIAEPIGDLINTVSGVKATQDFNSKEAETQRGWEETMRNSSVKSMQDQLKNAGINSAMYWSNGGSGATVPNGAAATSSATGGATLASIVGSLAGMSVGLAKNGMKDIAAQAAQKTINITNNYKKYNNIMNK